MKLTQLIDSAKMYLNEYGEMDVDIEFICDGFTRDTITADTTKLFSSGDVKRFVVSAHLAG